MRGSATCKKLGANMCHWQCHCIWETNVHHSNLHRVLSHWIVPTHVNEPQPARLGWLPVPSPSFVQLVLGRHNNSMATTSYNPIIRGTLPGYKWKCNHSYSGPTAQLMIVIACYCHCHGALINPAAPPKIPTENVGDVCRNSYQSNPVFVAPCTGMYI